MCILMQMYQNDTLRRVERCGSGTSFTKSPGKQNGALRRRSLRQQLETRLEKRPLNFYAPVWVDIPLQRRQERIKMLSRKIFILFPLPDRGSARQTV